MSKEEWEGGRGGEMREGRWLESNARVDLFTYSQQLYSQQTFRELASRQSLC